MIPEIQNDGHDNVIVRERFTINAHKIILRNNTMKPIDARYSEEQYK